MTNPIENQPEKYSLDEKVRELSNNYEGLSKKYNEVSNDLIVANQGIGRVEEWCKSHEKECSEKEGRREKNASELRKIITDASAAITTLTDSTEQTSNQMSEMAKELRDITSELRIVSSKEKRTSGIVDKFLDGWDKLKNKIIAALLSTLFLFGLYHYQATHESAHTPQAQASP